MSTTLPELPAAYDEDQMRAFAQAAITADRSAREGEAVGVVGAMPGTDGFTMACFRAADVPIGTKLYTAPADRGVAEWQDIETAPHRFSPPLSTVNHHAPDILGLWGQAFYCVCSWGGPDRPYWIGSDNKRVPFQPTRWMPLPAAPTHTKG